ncbi:hypothetical protein CR513_54470, partial [Mucuna pruriens]
MNYQGANKFELISIVQNLSQIKGLSTEKPLAHLKKFLYFTDTSHHSLDECTHKFLLKCFLLSKSNKLNKDVMNFSQFDHDPYMRPRKNSRKCLQMPLS